MEEKLKKLYDAYYDGTEVGLKSAEEEWFRYRVFYSEPIDGLVPVRIFNFFGHLQYVPIDDIIFY